LAQEANGWGIDFAASHLTLRVHTILAGTKKVPAWMVGLRVVSGAMIVALFFGLAPSLMILLSFTQKVVAETAVISDSSAPRPAVRPAVRANRRARSTTPLLASPVSSSTDEQGDQMMAPQTYTANAATQSRSGPQLLHRGDLAAVDKQQTVALTDADSAGQMAKSDGHRGSNVQQTATAALGIYRRISATDRH
jgi:hypothetical protein